MMFADDYTQIVIPGLAKTTRAEKPLSMRQTLLHTFVLPSRCVEIVAQLTPPPTCCAIVRSVAPQEYAEQRLVEIDDWDTNFKALKKRRKDADRLATQVKIGWCVNNELEFWVLQLDLRLSASALEQICFAQ